MVDDHVGHDAPLLGDCRNVLPRANPRVDRGVIRGVESRICAVNRGVEGKDVHSPKGREVGIQQVTQSLDSGNETVGIGDELRGIVTHICILKR